MAKTYDRQSAKNFIIGQVRAADMMDFDTDSAGQLLIYTNIYKWSNETLHDEPEPILEKLVEVEIKISGQEKPEE